MMFLSYRKLNQRGVAHHLILPVIAILAVAGIGTLLLGVDHAATVNLYKGSCAQNKQLLQSAAASADRACTQRVQDLIDIYQYSATNHFAIGGAGETFNYKGENMVLMNGNYNGATQSAVNTIAKSPSLTNTSVSGTTIKMGTWQAFCTAINGKLGTAAFTSYNTYDFSPSKNKAAGYYIASSGRSIFSTVCGSLTTTNFNTGSGGTGSSAAGSAEGKAFLARAEKWQGLGYANTGGYGGDGGLMHLGGGYTPFIKACEGGVSGGTPKITSGTNSQCATDCSGFISLVVDDVLHTSYVWLAGSGVMTGTGSSNWFAVGINNAQPGDIAVSYGHVEFVKSGTGQGMTTYGEHASGQTVGNGGGFPIVQVYRWK